MVIEVSVSFSRLRLKLNGITHISLPDADKVKIQAWKFPKLGYYAIEFYTADGPVLCEYDNEQIWKEILSKLEEAEII